MTILMQKVMVYLKDMRRQLGNVDLGGDIILKGAFNEWL